MASTPSIDSLILDDKQTVVISDGELVDVDESTRPDREIGIDDVVQDTSEPPVSPQNAGQGGEVPDNTPPTEQDPITSRNTVIVRRKVRTVISDFTDGYIQQCIAEGAIAIAHFKNGTEREVLWSEVFDPRTPAGSIVMDIGGIATAQNQNFWSDSNGAHVTENTKTDWNAEYAKTGHGELANPPLTKPWHNILINSLGILLRRGLVDMTSISRSAIAFFDGLGNNEANIMAYFGIDGAQIGRNTEKHMVLDSDGINVYDEYGNLAPLHSSNIEADHARIGDIEANYVQTQTLEANYAHITDGVIDNATIGVANVDDLDANYAHITDGVIDNATIGVADVDDLDANYAHITEGVIDNATISAANVSELESNYAHITNGVIDNATIGFADVDGLDANYAHVTDGVIDNATIGVANVDDLDANYAHITDGVIDNATIGHADVDGLNANYAHVTNGVIDNADIDQADVRNLSANYAHVTNGVIDNADIDQADVRNLSANYAHLNNGVIDNATIGYADVDGLRANYAHVTDGTIDNATIGHASVNGLSANYAHVTNGVIDNADIDQADVRNLSANYAHVTNGVIDNADIDQADVRNLSANYAHVANGVIDNAKIGYADVNGLSAHYAQIDMANVNNAWVQNGVIKDGSIGNAMIHDVSANKLTAGTIDASKINVTNLTAEDISVSRINGQAVTGKSVVDALAQHESDISDLDDRIDDEVEALNNRIDGAIETYTGTAVPTLNNAPASSWTTATERKKHVGDVYFVVNSQSQQNGYNYRFTQNGNNFSWQLIKDTDITNALSRLNTAEGKITTFDSDIDQLKTDTGTLITKTDTLETSLGDKVSVTTFNNLSDTVDGHSQTITQHTQAISTKADGETVTLIANRVSKTEQDITGINNTISELSDTVENKADGSTVSTLSNTVNSISDTVSGHTQSISNITNTQTTIQKNAVKSTVQLWFTKANTTAPSKPTAHVTTNNAATANAWNLAVPTYNASYPHYYYCYEYEYINGTYGWSAVTRDIAMGETQSTARTANSTATTAKSTADKNVKESVQLWFTKANNTAPSKPTSAVTTNNASTGNAWNLAVPTYNASYPHYFYCMQYKLADGTYTWSDVIYDRATTESQSVARTTSGNLTTLQNNYAEFKQTMEGFQSTVGETYATKNELSTVAKTGTEYIVGTQTASTASWTGVTNDSALYAGKSIAYYLPYATPSGGTSTLNLTLSGGGTTGAKNVRINNSNVTTHFPAGSVINLTWDGTYWKTSNYDSNSNTYDRRLHNDNITALAAVTAGHLIAGIATGYKQLAASSAFDLAYPILYASAAIAANAANKATYEAIPGINFSTTGTIQSGAANKMLWLKGSVNGSTFTIASSNWLTTVIPTSADNLFYIPLGVLTSATNGYFSTSDKLYAFLDGKFQRVDISSSTRLTSVEDRVTNAETEITQNTEAIALRAKSSDVYTKSGVDGLISQEVTNRNAAIEESASAINLSVSQNYTSKTDFNDLKIGGRNLLQGSLKVGASNAPGWISNGGGTNLIELTTQDGEDVIHYSGSISNTNMMPSISSSVVAPCEWGNQYVYSGEIKVDRDVLVQAGAPLHYHAGARNSNSLFNLSVLNHNNAPKRDIESHAGETISANTWFKTSYIFTYPNSPADANYNYPGIRAFIYGGVLATAYTGVVNVWVRRVKIEKGNKPTDWSPAPEDVESYTDTKVSEAEAAIKITTDNITTEVGKKTDKSAIISTINQSAEAIKISASKVDIEGAAMFTSGGALNKVVTLTQTEWYSSTSASSKAGGSWATTQPSIAAGRYIWERTKVTYSNGTSEYKPSAEGVCVQGQTNLSAYSTTSQMNTAIGTAKSQAIESANTSTDTKLQSYSTTAQADAKYDAKGAATDAVNNLVIGGRNLLLFTDTLKKGNDTGVLAKDGIVAWGGANSVLTQTDTGIKMTAAGNSQECIGIPLANNGSIANNEDVMLSFEARGTITAVGQFYWIQASGGNVAMTNWLNGSASISLNEMTWTKFSTPVKNSEANVRTCTKILMFYNLGSGQSGKWIELKKGSVKLEKGTKPTDWSPAPEDVTADISAAKSWVATCSTDAAEVNKVATITPATTDFKLATGVIVHVKFTVTSTAAVASLTLNVNGTGAKPLRAIRTGSITTMANHAQANVTYECFYDGTNWIIQENYNSDTTNRTRWQNVIKAREANALTAGKLICGNSSGYKNIAASVAFDLSFPILYAGSTQNTSGGTTDNNYLNINGVNFSTTGTIQNGTQYAPIYLKGTIVGNTFTVAASNFLTCTIPTSADTCFYIPIGMLYNSTTNGYFNSSKDLYAYIDGRFRQVTPTEVVATQLIYISKASGTSSVSANTTWVTANSDSQNTWTTKRPTYNTSYPVLFIATQTKRLDSTVTCTSPIKDDTTTIIDGGHITTGTIDASKATITNINASNITTGTLSADRIATGAITIGKLDATTQNNITAGVNAKSTIDNLEIGGRNLYKSTTAIGWVNDASGTISAYDNSYHGRTLTSSKGSVTARIYYIIDETNIDYTISFVATASVQTTISIDVCDNTVQYFSVPATTPTKIVCISKPTRTIDSVYHFIDITMSNAVTLKLADIKVEKGNKPTAWSKAPEDVDAAIATKASSSSAVAEEQYIYIQAVSGTNSVNGTTTWVSATGESTTSDTAGLTPAWTTKRPTYRSKYPVIFVAKQKKMVSGTVTCSTPMKDDTLTIIDGGHITTGTIDASKAAVTNINASNITTGTLSADRIAAGAITVGKLDTATQTKITNGDAAKTAFDNLEIGGRNLLKHSQVTNENKTNRSISLELVAKDGRNGYLYPSASSPTAWTINSGGTCYWHLLEANTYYTYSVWLYWTGNPTAIHFTSFGHFSVINSASTASDKTHEDVLSERKYSPATLLQNTWTLMTLTFKTNSLSGSSFNVYPRYNIAANSGDLYIGDMKLEKGTKATDWSPAPEDVDTAIDAKANSSDVYTKTQADGKFYNEQVITSSTADKDLNNYTTTGIYHCATSMTNAPMTNHSTVVVEWNVGTKYQEYHPDNLTYYYKRLYTSSAWQSWTKIDAVGAYNLASTANDTANAAAPKTSAIKEEQRVYYRSNSATPPSAGPTSWVTSTATANATWTTKRIPNIDSANTAYKYLYTCIQKKTVSDTVTCTTVLLDDSITVIDGGNIITGTVAANQIASNAVTAAKITSGAVTADKVAAGAITADKITAGAITTEKLAVKDLTNYCQLNSTTAASYGYSVVADSSNPNAPWFQRNALARDNYPSDWFDCKGGESFRVTATVSSTVQGKASSDATENTYMQIRVGVNAQTANGTNEWPTALIATSSSGGTETTATGVVTISANAVRFRAFIQINGAKDFTGVLKIRKISIFKMGNGELIVDGSITSTKLAIDLNNTINGKANSSSAVAEEQYIYIQATSGTSSVSKNETWVTATGESTASDTAGLTPAWTTKRPTYRSKYPVIFVAKQKKTVSGTVTCSTPIKDDTTTIIDGGHITTGTIDASKATITNINASNITTGTVAAARIDAAHLTIGQSQVTNLTTDLATKSNKTLPDTRNDNQPPSWYFTNYPRQRITEFKYANKIGIGSSAVFCSLETVVPWADSSGGYPVQYATVSGVRYYRTGTAASTWSAWTQEETTSGAQTKANTAVNNLDIGGRNLYLYTEYSNFFSIAGANNSSSIVTHTVETDAKFPGFAILKFTVSSSTTKAGIYTYANRYNTLNGQLDINETYTFSFMAKASTTAQFESAQAIEERQSVINSSSMELSTEWKKFWITFSVLYPTQATCFYIKCSEACSVYVTQLKLEKGNKPTDWSPAPEDVESTTTGLGIKWNYSGFTTSNAGECYLCAWDYQTGTFSDANGWVWFNGSKRTIPKGMVNPNSIAINVTIYIVCRLSSATATTGTNYIVWYDGSWKYLTTGIDQAASNAEVAAWTWAVATDIVLGSFVMLDADTSNVVDCQQYTPPLTSQQVTSGATAYAKAAAANTLATTANNKSVAFRGLNSVAAGTAAKTVACPGFALTAGYSVTVYNSTANTVAGAITLNVNSTGAKTVYVAGAATSDTNRLLWAAGSTITFVYDGSYYRVADNPGSWMGSTCSVAEGTAAKTTTANEIVIFKGTSVTVPMTYSNTATATLNVSSLGASNIYYGTSTTSPTKSNGYAWPASAAVIFTYDGKFWRTGNQTFIDGGNIITGTIAADRIKANVISAVNNGTGTINADRINASSLSIGYSQLTGTPTIPSKVSQLTNDSKFQTDTQVSSTASTAASNAVNDIRIGGRNLAKGKAPASTATTEATIITTGTNTSQFVEGVTFTIARVEGVIQYVLSFEAYASVNRNIRCHWYSPNTTTKALTNQGTTSTGSDGNIDIAITTGWKRYWVTWTQSDAAATNKSLIVGRAFNLSSGGSTVHIRAIKMEIGNKPTDWSPAPEDVATSVTNAGKTATQYITNVDNDGIKIHAINNPTANYALINASGLDIYESNVSVAQFGDGSARIGKASGWHTLIDVNGFNIIYGENTYCSLTTNDFTIGRTDDYDAYNKISRYQISNYGRKNGQSGDPIVRKYVIGGYVAEFGQHLNSNDTNEGHKDLIRLNYPSPSSSNETCIEITDPYASQTKFKATGETVSAGSLELRTPLAATYVGALPASKITSGTFDAERIPSLNASKITAGTLGADRIPSLNASKITAGTLGVDRIPSLNASKITAGTLGADRIPSLNASKITAGTFDAARIPSLDASKITSGTLARARGGTGYTTLQRHDFPGAIDGGDEVDYQWLVGWDDFYIKYNGVAKTLILDGGTLKANLASGYDAVLAVLPSTYSPTVDAIYTYCGTSNTNLAGKIVVRFTSSGSLRIYNASSITITTNFKINITATWAY